MIQHINIKEAEALLHAIRVYDLTNLHLNFYTDNTTLWWYLHKWGGRSPALNNIVKQIWSEVEARQLVILPHYVPSEHNPADSPSRRRQPALHSASLSSTIMEEIHRLFRDPSHGYVTSPFVPKVDWMASDENSQCDRFINEAQDFFCQDLDTISPGWINPPWFLIPRVLGYLAKFPPSATALTVVPYKPHASWWPLLLQMRVGKPLYISHLRDAYLLPNDEVCQGPAAPLCVCILQGLDVPPSRSGD